MKRNKSIRKGKSSDTFTVHETTTLLPLLHTLYPKRSRNAVKSILTQGRVMVEGEVVTQYNYHLAKGTTITVSHQARVSQPKLTGLTIIHEDKDIIVIEKDTGLLSIATHKEKQMTAYHQLSQYVKQQHPKERIFIVHRLDKDTSGVMIFARSEHVKRKLQDDWKKNVQERTYVALVEGKVAKQSGTITSWLNETATHLMYSSPKPNGGKKAITHYKILQANAHYSLLEVQLDTGRKNQIRVHMQEVGHPIVGDKKYGAKGNPIGRLGLHAKTITFTHPGNGKLVSFRSNMPTAFDDRSKT
ncbi:RluA family pseudouridine synthase [Pontibacillus salicampi]|uniref:Pseudouridine synthase n=1 Tax=Pontibacillus salicampi TaxID=1449801 RepID=A0ABV6LKF9_9BACI